MRKLVFLIVIFLGAKSALFSQQKISWNDLTDVQFSNVYNANYDEYFLKPAFGTSLASLEGKKVSLRGYFLDFSSDEDPFFMVSRNPMASCFFCGGSGPESIVEVMFIKRPKYKTDQIVEVIGILELNDDDVDHCNYILKEATGRLIE
ncbi:hypothetical protein [Aquimarina litoralis]|uniref:hypothetical protein n=1 Tax=Aquimarina litoralis TaxID=584605 RepID=UPI001C57E013|nr:hypothetical protein [Aquimarina litoralis]MBW1296671.1 hypothetical protein [Aquimarina litoralis]